MVRSGYITLRVSVGGTALGVGSNGYGWPQIATVFSDVTSAMAYYFSSNTTGANPSNGPDNRRHGLPLRCLSTALEG